MYHQGNFTDLCYGPHIPSTGRIKFIKLMSVAGAYWRGNEKNKMLQRIYGITFPTKQELDEYLFRIEEAKRRDHRKIGAEMELFLLTPKVGSGLPLWLPKGTIVRETFGKVLARRAAEARVFAGRNSAYRKFRIIQNIGTLPVLQRFAIRADNDGRRRAVSAETDELPSPSSNLFGEAQVVSGSADSFSEFGTVYRYEQSGEMSGLTRVRGFTQDDAHIYCSHDQLKDEIARTVELTQFVFRTFGMEVTTRLSFRDDKNVDKFGGEAA